ncbi:hypothetical protein GQR58_023906 [Nymphon striatum]|nr:hypothetical protein GQR58_023906 [Nymphon striatum]
MDFFNGLSTWGRLRSRYAPVNDPSLLKNRGICKEAWTQGNRRLISPEILESTAEGPAASLDNSTLHEDGDTTATERTFFIEKKYDKHEAMLFKLQVFQRQDEMRWEKEEETKRKY